MHLDMEILVVELVEQEHIQLLEQVVVLIVQQELIIRDLVQEVVQNVAKVNIIQIRDQHHLVLVKIV